MNVSIIGAGRKKNGIGKYIAKYFHKNGARITSILGSSEISARNAANDLNKINIQARPYCSFKDMLNCEKIDSIVIASPYPTHHEYLIQSIEAGLDIFCEKPFIFNSTGELTSNLDHVLTQAKNKKLILAMNSQWPFSISTYEKLCGPIIKDDIQTFFMHLSPVCSGKEMIIDSVPHALSLLYYTMQGGKIDDVDVESHPERIILKFKYYTKGQVCKVLLKLVREKKQPRTLRYGFNDKVVKRVLDLQNYDIFFNYRNKTIKISDPLELSVKNFIFSVKNRKEPTIGPSHIKATTHMLKELTIEI